MQKLITNARKIMIKTNKLPYIQYWDVNILYGWENVAKLSSK